MKRHKKMVLLAHCILNQNAVVYPLARAKGGFTTILEDYISEGYGIYQLPCPEMRYLGLSRQPMTKAEYSTPDYHSLCNELSNEVIRDLKQYIDDQVHIEVVHGINESPTCSISGQQGHFMTYLLPKLYRLNEHLIIKEVATEHNE